MPKLIWEKKLQEALKRQQRFGWSVREKRGKVLVQRHYSDTNKKYYCFTNKALCNCYKNSTHLSDIIFNFYYHIRLLLKKFY